tara:strand:+ start:265 stop:462 length:198 start_codon:yes stop_codon:yes gene_type:complete
LSFIGCFRNVLTDFFIIILIALYKTLSTLDIKKGAKLWDILKNIEEDVKSDQKREELEKEIRESK